MPNSRRKFLNTVIAMFALACVAVGNYSLAAADDSDEETRIAKSLAAMVNAGLAVIAKNQDHIDNPSIADKGLDGKTALAQALQHCERLLLEVALHRAHGNQSHTARLLGITPSSGSRASRTWSGGLSCSAPCC